MKSKKASIKEGIAWIAENDEPTEKNERIVAEMISVQLLAELFGQSVDYVAGKVIMYRVKNGIYL